MARVKNVKRNVQKTVEKTRKTDGVKKTRTVKRTVEKTKKTAEKNTYHNLIRHCGICGLTNFSPAAFAKHKAEVHPTANREFECTLCDIRLTSSAARTRHYLGVHPGVHSWICQKCGHTAPSRDGIKGGEDGMRYHKYCNLSSLRTDLLVRKEKPKVKRISLAELNIMIGVVRKDAAASVDSVESVDNDDSTVCDDSEHSIDCNESNDRDESNDLFIDFNVPIGAKTATTSLLRHANPIMDFTGIDELTTEEEFLGDLLDDLPEEIEIDINKPWSCGFFNDDEGSTDV